MKRYRVTIDGRIYDVEIDDPDARPVTARLAGAAYSVEVEPDRSAGPDDEPASIARTAMRRPHEPPDTTAGAGSVVAGTQTMTAPIPGVIASVVVAADQAVARGDELLTVDAMKMLNVMRAPWTGTVATVHVAKGDRVVQGQPLVTFVAP